MTFKRKMEKKYKDIHALTDEERLADLTRRFARVVSEYLRRRKAKASKAILRKALRNKVASTLLSPDFFLVVRWNFEEFLTEIEQQAMTVSPAAFSNPALLRKNTQHIGARLAERLMKQVEATPGAKAALLEEYRRLRDKTVPKDKRFAPVGSSPRKKKN